MAGEAVVGALRVVLGMDTAAFEDGAKKASKGIESFGTQMKAVFAGVGLERIVEQLVSSVIHFTKATFENIDALGKQAQKVGVTVEEFSALNFAAQLADVSTESLSTALGKLSKNMADTAAGTGEAQKQFEALGIKVINADGTMRSVSAVLGDVADKFGKTTDGVNKTAAAIALFGKSGKELIPLLNDGSEGLREAADTAERMGLVISGPTFNAVQKFNDNLKILKLTAQGVANLVVAELVPAFVAITDQWVASAKTGEGIRTAADRISSGLKEFLIVVNQAVIADHLLALAFLELQNVITRFPDIDASSESMRNLSEIVSQLPKALGDARTQMEGYLKITVPGKKTTDDLERTTSKFGETMNSLALKTRVARGDFLALAEGFPEMAARLKLTDESGKNLSTTVAGLTAQQTKLNEQMQLLKAAQITQEFLTPWQQYEQQMIRLNALVAQGKLGQDTYRAASLKTATDLATAWGVTAQSIVSPMADAFKTLAQMNKKYAGAAKALAIAEAIVNTYLAATKALASGFPPFNYIAAAAVTAAGLANVAKISATEFATGGSFKIGGGIGGIDNQMVTIKGTPGEMVDVRRPGQERGTSTEVVVRGMRPDEVFTGRWLRGFVDALNQGDRDGYRLVFAER